MDTSLPTSPVEISAEWLTETLHDSGTLPMTGVVASVQIDPASAGIGFLGEVARLAVEYGGDAESCPSTMIAKFPTSSPEVKAMLRPTRVYEREHRFYAELADTTPLRTPDVYHIICNTSDDQLVDEEYLLLLEDFSNLELGDQITGVSAEQAGSTLSQLATHHAYFWNEKWLQGSDFIPKINGPLNKAVQSLYSDALPVFEEIFGFSLLPEMLDISRSYGTNHPSLLDQLASLPQTLTHGDFRADNLFFDSGDSVAVIDWQGISRCGAAADVGYFLSQNMEIQDRRQHETDLLHVYHQSLVSAGVKDYEFSTLFDNYRLGVLYGWIIPVFAVGSLNVSSERAMTLWTSVVERTQDAILQHGAQEFFSV
jgi:hypothetical protein